MHRLLSVLVMAFVAVGVVALGGSPALAVDNGQIGIRPANEPDYFHVKLAPGAAADETAIISNHTNAPSTLLTYPVDGLTTPQGGFGFAAQTDPKKTVGAWAQLTATQVTVPAKSEIRLPFRLNVPSTASPGDYYGGVVIQAAPVPGKTVTVQGGTAVQLNIIQRQAVRIYLTVEGTRRNELTNGSLTWKRDGDQVVFSLPISNTGNTTLHPTSSVALASTIGANQTLHFNTPESLLPGQSITLHATLPHAAPIQLGAATVTEHSEAGNRRSTADFTYVPWGIALGTLAAIGLLTILGYRFARFIGRARRAIAVTEDSPESKAGQA